MIMEFLTLTSDMSLNLTYESGNITPDLILVPDLPMILGK